MIARIAHVLDAPFDTRAADGVQQVVNSLARAQADSGRSVAVVSTVNGMHLVGQDASLARSTTPDLARPRAGLKPCATVAGDPQPGVAAASQPGVAAASRCGAALRPCAGNWLAERFMSRWLDRPLAEEVLAWRPDLLHFHSVHVPQHIALAAQLDRSGIPYCVTVHGGLFPAALRRGRLKKAAFNLLFERRYLNGARFVHAVSPHEVAGIRRCGVDSPVVVVPNALPPDAAVRPSQPDALYRTNPALRGRLIYMFVGRLDPWQKGLDLLVDAFARARLHDASLVLVGPDSRGSRRRLARRADRLGILHQVVFTGPAFGEDRANLCAAADVFVHPSRWEGLSLSVLAAAAGGKACLITRDADPLGELERAGAAMLVDATVPGVAAGLARSAALGRDELHAMGARARRIAEAYPTWLVIAHRLMAAYEHACGDDEQRSA